MREGGEQFLHSSVFYSFGQFGEDGEEEDHGEEEPTLPIDEGVGGDEKQRCGGNQSDDRKAEHAERVLEIQIGAEARAEEEIQPADGEHDDKAREDDGEGSEQAAPDAARSGVAHIGGAVDTDRSGRYLTDSHYIHELRLRHPRIRLHLVLDKRQDSQTPAEAEESDFEETEKELKVEHSFYDHFIVRPFHCLTASLND